MITKRELLGSIRNVGVNFQDSSEIVAGIFTIRLAGNLSGRGGIDQQGEFSGFY